MNNIRGNLTNISALKQSLLMEADDVSVLDHKFGKVKAGEIAIKG